MSCARPSLPGRRAADDEKSSESSAGTTGLRLGTRGDRGSAAVLGTVLVGVLAAVSVFVAALGGVLADRRRAESSADLAALAAAAALQSGRDPCAAARSVANRNRASVVGCRVAGDTVTVRARFPTRWLLGRAVRVTAEARAGPVTPDSG
jgi:secretion/DNA translocation related TadE-like protein